MKPDPNEFPNLRDAFPPVPEGFTQRIRETLEKALQEPPPVRRTIPVRTILIAAVMILSMSSVAFALSQIRWADFYRDYGVRIPRTAEQAMQETESQSFTVGPVTFTLQEVFSDGRLLLGATAAHVQDGNATFIEYVGADLPDGHDTEIPVYTIRAVLQVNAPYHGTGEDMEDVMVDSDGHIVYFNMQSVDEEYHLKEVPVTYQMFAYQIDPDNGFIVDSWSAEEQLTIPVTELNGEKVYLPETSIVIGNVNVIDAKADLTSAGVYLLVTFSANEQVDPHSLDLPGFLWYDEDKNLQHDGMNLSLTIDDSAWPLITCEYMLSMDELPEQLILSDRVNSVILK
ncbi:MAG: hypothetical protein IJX67_09615 [Oscillospiraceae bacterium]|nr:hypothetical protein [Clostridia bacterium]MBQ9168648.1 hypothetical protein [Oscillospiraceae bacterium]